MPSNSTGQLAVYQDIVGVSSFTFSTQLTGVRASKIPLNVGGPGTAGLTVFLPPDPSDGDSYELQDSDGSCGINNLVFIKPDPEGEATVGHLPFFAFIFPMQGARFTFDAEANDWSVNLNANGIFSLLSTVSGTGPNSGNVTPGDLTATTTPAVLFAIRVSPKAGGLFLLTFALEYTLSAADTLTLAVEAASNVTNISGGFSTGANVFFEGVGNPVVVASDPPIQRSEWAAQIPADAIAKQTATWAGIVAVQSSGDNPGAVIVTLKTAGGASVTAMSLAADVHEVA